MLICKILEITATKFCHFNWLTDWFIDWLIDCCLFHTRNSYYYNHKYGLYDSHTVFLFSVFYEIQMIFIFFFSTKSFCVLLKNESNKRGRHRSSSTVYTEWEGITNPIFLTPPLMISSILYHTLHYNKSVSALLISQLFLQSLRPRNLSFIHRVRVERSRLFSCQTISSSSSTFSHLRSSDLVSFICFGLQVNCPGFHLSAIFYMHLRLFLWITVFWLQQCLKHAVGH